MKELLTYALESSICLLLFWFFYAAFLSGDTQHVRNRTYLLLSVTLAALIPLMNFRMITGSPVIPVDGLVRLLLPEVRITGSGSGAGLFADPVTLIVIVYLTGAAVSATLFLSTGIRLLWLIATRANQNKIITCQDDRPVCYSAFGYIFISGSIPKQDAERMIAHERNHLSRLHHIDLCITAIITVLQWFNPAAYLVRRSLMAVHEYEADSECLNLGEEVTSYQQLLVSAVLNTRLSLISNTFSKSSLLKNRIIMMTKKKSGSNSSLKLLLAVPLAAFLFFTFSCNDMRKETAPVEPIDPTVGFYDSILLDNVYNVVTELPVFGTDAAKSNENLFKWILENLKYPQEAKEKGITGKVILSFIVDENGNIIRTEVIKSADPLLDQAAIDLLIKSPKWQPGLNNGKPVKVKMALPVSFALN
jgi:TonB family protein